MKELLKEKPLTAQIRESFLGNAGGDQTQWTFYGSPLKAYEQTFGSVLDGTSIRSFVSGKTFPVVLDLMSPSETLRDLFMDIRDRDKIGIAVSLSDHRANYAKRVDKRLGISQIAGDITRSSTWDEIVTKLGGRKADLIMERGSLGLIYIPQHPKFQAIMINKLWDSLSSNNGMLLLQVRYSNLVKKWVDYLGNKNIKACFRFGVDIFPSLRIDKKPNSPSELPFL